MTAVSESTRYDIAVRRDIDTAVITPWADLTDAYADQLRETLMTAAANHTHLIVDLHAVRIIEPVALSLLVRARQRTRDGGGIFALVAPSRFVLTVLHTMRLETAFPTCPDLPAAIDSIKTAEAPAPK